MTKEKLHDLLYEKAVRLLDEHNPCEFSSDGVCVIGRDNGCCGGCKHLGEKGCTTEALGCRLELCPPLVRKHPDLAKELLHLRILGEKNGLYAPYRCSPNATLSFRGGRTITIFRHDSFPNYPEGL